MLLPNPAVDERALGELVRERYRADPAGLAFAPVGGDGWHYRCPPFWVSNAEDDDRWSEPGLCLREARDTVNS